MSVQTFAAQLAVERFDERVICGLATLIENCKLTGINPHTWLTATLTNLANGHPASRIDELLPHAHVG